MEQNWKTVSPKVHLAAAPGMVPDPIASRYFGSPYPQPHERATPRPRLAGGTHFLQPEAAPIAALRSSQAESPSHAQPPVAQLLSLVTPPGNNQGDAPEGLLHHTWTARRGLSRRVLALACSYMEDNLGENFTLDDLARAVGVSRFHFSRLFRVSTGESPMGFSLRLRIEHAKGMLLKGDRRICEIAMALGFFDQSHFARTFRRITGVSPGEYVRMCDVAAVAV